jgi:hypothetical protein
MHRAVWIVADVELRMSISKTISGISDPNSLAVHGGRFEEAEPHSPGLEHCKSNEKSRASYTKITVRSVQKTPDN